MKEYIKSKALWDTYRAKHERIFMYAYSTRHDGVHSDQSIMIIYIVERMMGYIQWEA